VRAAKAEAITITAYITFLFLFMRHIVAALLESPAPTYMCGI